MLLFVIIFLEQCNSTGALPIQQSVVPIHIDHWGMIYGICLFFDNFELWEEG